MDYVIEFHKEINVEADNREEAMDKAAAIVKVELKEAKHPLAILEITCSEVYSGKEAVDIIEGMINA